MLGWSALKRNMNEGDYNRTMPVCRAAQLSTGKQVLLPCKMALYLNAFEEARLWILNASHQRATLRRKESHACGGDGGAEDYVLMRA